MQNTDGTAHRTDVLSSRSASQARPDASPEDPPGRFPASPSVVICTLTFRRPDRLARLLPALADQALHAQRLGWRASVLVVDNDPAGTGWPVVQAYREQRGDQVAVRYAREARPGISAARNRALDAAQGADYLAFIDDDESPVDDWLAELLAAQQRYASAAVVGFVVPEYEVPPDPWILAGEFFDRRQFTTGTTLPAGATNNILIDLAAVQELDLRFDERFGLSGGEDSLFTMQLAASGRRIVWCDEARVTDLVPASRLTRRWVLLRKFSAGNVLILCRLTVAPSRGSRAWIRFASFLGGVGRISYGIARYGVGLVKGSLADQAHGLRFAARGAGFIAGSVGYRYLEYRRS